MLLSHADILRRHGDGWEFLRDGYIGVKEDTITYIGVQKPDNFYGVEKDLSGHLLVPGFYNMHTHTAMTLLRGLGRGLPLERWLNEAMYPIEARLTSPDISVGARLAMMEMLASGVVSFTDMYDQPRTAMAEVLQAGMKANLTYPVWGTDNSISYGKNHRAQESVSFFRECNRAGDGKIIVDFALHAEYTCCETLVRCYAEDCKKLNANMNLHLSETQKEHEACKTRYGKTPARWFYDLGVFSNPTIAAHCVWVEPEDVVLLSKNEVRCVHNPSSNMKLGSGFMPIRSLLDNGVRLTIGTDGAASNNNLNFMEEIHLASIIHSGYTGNPSIVNPEELLTMATVNGASAQSRPNCGALEIGNRADIVAVNMVAPHLMPANDIPALLTYSAQASDITMTMVDGKVLYENGEYFTIDFDKVKFDLKQTTDRLL